MSTTPGIPSITLGNRLGALGQELGRAKRYPTGVVIRSMSVPLAYQRIENVVFDNPELYLSKSRPVHVLDSLIAESPCTGMDFVRASLTPVVKFWEYDIPGMIGINGDRRIYIPVLKG